MSWRSRSTLGGEFVGEVYDLLRVEDDYVIDRPHGFTWWAGDFATTIQTDEGLFRQSTVTYRVTAETEFLKGRGHMRELAIALEHEMDQCSFSGPVYDQESDTFRLYSCVYAGDENAVWLRKMFAAAVALQVAEAHEMGHRLASAFHAVPASSQHPRHDLRHPPSPIVTQAYGFFSGSGCQPSKWIDQPEWKQSSWVMEREARTFDLEMGRSMVGTWPWDCGEGDIVIAVKTDEPHPKVGNGLHLTLSIPLTLTAEGIGHLVLELNGLERTDYKRCHTLGSWCEHEGKLAFRLFVPNCLYDHRMLHDLLVNFSTRAIWANEFFVAKRAEAMSSHT